MVYFYPFTNSHKQMVANQKAYVCRSKALWMYHSLVFNNSSGTGKYVVDQKTKESVFISSYSDLKLIHLPFEQLQELPRKQLKKIIKAKQYQYE